MRRSFLFMAKAAEPVSASAPPQLREAALEEARQRYRRLERQVSRVRPGEDQSILQRAFEFALERHGQQRRKTGEPYIFHPLAVASLLVEMQMDQTCLVTGLLHDVLEDTETSAEEMRRIFGEEVTRCVEGVTKIGKLQFYSRADRQAESVRKMLIAMVSDIRIIIVKFADRIHNLRDMADVPRDRQIAKAQETLEIYCPIAHRLGMGKVRAEMEDLAFQLLEPDVFRDIVEKVSHHRNASEEFLHQIRQAVEARLAKDHIPARVEARLKRPYSIWQKMKRQNISIDQVYDLLALRVITDSVRNCYGALGAIHSEWSPIFGRMKDFIAIPRPNLYQSLHTSVMVPGGQMFEVQIRTEEMHRTAEDGIAAHWKYKEGRKGLSPEDHRIQWLRQLVEWQKDVADPGDFEATLKQDLQQEDVFVFTPKGRVVVLPYGSTPVDFAYAIHSQLGDTCTGAKINTRIVPLRYQLKNGEVVEILTSPGSHPSRDWLSFVKTGKARSKIKHFINELERNRAVEIGQKYLETEARRHNVWLSRISKPAIEAVAGEYGFAKSEDLYAALGYGRYSARQVLHRLAPEVVAVEEKLTPLSPPADPNGELVVKVKGDADVMTFRARCCNPILGEPITGYITRGRGVAIHSHSCPNVQNLMYEADRRIDVEWGTRSGKDAFVVKLQIRTDDRPGMLNQFTSILANEGCNIRTLEAHTDHKAREHGAVVDMTIEIRDKKQLDRLTKLFRGVTGVHNVDRRR